MTELKTKPLNPFPWIWWSLIKILALPLGHSLQFSRILRELEILEQERPPLVPKTSGPTWASNSSPQPPIFISENVIVDYGTVLFFVLFSTHCWLLWIVEFVSNTIFTTLHNILWWFFTERHFFALHPLSCSLPDVCKLCLPQNKQKQRDFLHISIEDWHW